MREFSFTGRALFESGDNCFDLKVTLVVVHHLYSFPGFVFQSPGTGRNAFPTPSKKRGGSNIRSASFFRVVFLNVTLLPQHSSEPSIATCIAPRHSYAGRRFERPCRSLKSSSVTVL